MRRRQRKECSPKFIDVPPNRCIHHSEFREYMEYIREQALSDPANNPCGAGFIPFGSHGCVSVDEYDDFIEAKLATAFVRPINTQGAQVSRATGKRRPRRQQSKSKSKTRPRRRHTTQSQSTTQSRSTRRRR